SSPPTAAAIARVSIPRDTPRYVQGRHDEPDVGSVGADHAGEPVSRVTTLAEFVRGLIRAEHERKLAIRIPRERVLDDTASDDRFTPEDSYFTIRVAETFVRNGREYFREFSPLAVLMAEFVYAQERRGFPFLVGSQALKDLQDYVGGEHVE